MAIATQMFATVAACGNCRRRAVTSTSSLFLLFHTMALLICAVAAVDDGDELLSEAADGGDADAHIDIDAVLRVSVRFCLLAMRAG